MPDQVFDYNGYRVELSVHESGNESSTGVFLSTISFAPDHALADRQAWTHWERRAASVHLDATAARCAAAARVKAHIDAMAGAASF